jgi:hypothetical protein
MTRTLHLAGSATLLLILGAILSPQPISAQDYRQVLVQEDPGGTMVTASIRYPVGFEADPSGEEGTAFLLARLLEREGERRLREGFSRIQVQVGQGEFLITLLAPPERWASAFRTVESLVEGYVPPEADVALIRDQHLERLIFQEGAPVRDFEIERLRLLFGTTSPTARPSEGNRVSVRDLPAGGPAAFRDRYLDRSEAVVALVGPVTGADAGAVVRGPRTEVPSPRSFVEAPPLQPARVVSLAGDTVPEAALRAEPPSETGPRLRLRIPTVGEAALAVPSGDTGSLPWRTGDRSVIDRDLTSSWIAVAWPFPAGSPRVLLDFLGRTLREAVVSDPPDPGFYAAEVEVYEVGGAPVLVFTATVDPRTALRWEARILASMERVAEAPPSGAFFDLGRRRYRNAVLLDLAVPELRAAWLVRQSAAHGEAPDLQNQIWRISRDSLGGAAIGAGPPRILLFGPARMMEEYGSGGMR